MADVDSEQVIAGARTVQHVAEHFDNLKSAAQELFRSAAVSQRGYFTPSEDEATRHLLVSYWQSRNALVELVRSLHDDMQRTPELRSARFLVAYAGALTLVDAALFLRSKFEDRPLVRAKLNEAEPHFGIPVGTYDRIQQSLTRPLHVWHLYHAARYYQTHQDELQRVGAELQLTHLNDTIQKFQSKTETNLGVYLRERAKVRGREAKTAVRRDLLERAIYGLQKSVSQLISGLSTKRDHRPQLPTHAIQQLRRVLRPGDVLITRKEHALTNYFLPGFWPHAALYLGTHTDLMQMNLASHENLIPRWRRLLECDPTEPCRVLEALKDGVRIRSLASPLASDALLVLRTRLGPSDVAHAISRGMFHESKPYDFDFDFTRSDRLVCTEVVYRSFEQVDGVRFALTRRAGRLTLSAEDLIQMALERRHFELVATFVPSYTQDVVTGIDAEQIVKRTIGSGIGVI